MMQPSSYKNNKGKRICNITGWYMSEKLDGMKGRWIDGEFISRSDRRIDAPQWFLDLMPKIDIEGELYFGPNTFEKTGSLRCKYDHRAWKKVKFYIFDIVDHERSWRRRHRKLVKMSRTWVGKHPFRLVQWEEIKSEQDIKQRFKEVVAMGGEGLVMANPKAKYEDGRSLNILKYKKINDCEAIITGYRLDENGSRLVSFDVNPYTNGKADKKIQFNIGTGLKARQRYGFREKYPIGTIITYSYELMGKNGKPRTPVFKGIRLDM